MNLDKILEFDPLHTAEQIGLSTSAGLLLSMSHNLQKMQVLDGLGDTHYGMSLDKYIEVIESAGFVLAKKFEYPRDDYYIYWKDGLLLAFDSYGRSSVNGGHIYYNWRPNDDVSPVERCRIISSGMFKDKRIWAGYHDCREALLFHMNRMAIRGQFLQKWEYDARPFLVHYAEFLGNEVPFKERFQIYESLIQQKLSSLPLHIQECLAVSIEESK